MGRLVLVQIVNKSVHIKLFCNRNLVFAVGQRTRFVEIILYHAKHGNLKRERFKHALCNTNVGISTVDQNKIGHIAK